MALISVSLAMGLIVLGVVVMIVSGVKSVINGKQDLKRIAMILVPAVVFGISYAVLSDVSKAAILTTGLLMGLMILSIMFTGLRGTFKF